MNLRHSFFLCALLSASLLWPAAVEGQSAPQSPLSVQPIVVERIPFNVTVDDPGQEAVPFALMVLDDQDEVVFLYNGIIPATVRNVRVPATGDYQIMLTTAGKTWESHVRSLGGLITLLPPLIAILMALVFRQVYIALFAGVWIGGFIVQDYNVIRGFFYVIDHYVIDSLSGEDGWDHSSIAVFTLLLGGLVGIVSRSGGAKGIVNALAKYATTPIRGQLATWFMGIVIFFDDYTNTLIVGNTMRPITDKLKISREKLSYLVDSTAAPVACVAVITSWIGFEISLLKDAFESVGMLDTNPFTTFVSAIPYSYYPILTLVFGFFVARMGRDFGPMLTAERRARDKGLTLREGAVPISNIDTEIKSAENVPERWFNAAVPVLVVVVGTVVGLYVTGRESLIASGESAQWFDAIREGNSFVSLLWSSFAGCVVAMTMVVAQRILSVTDAINAWVTGIKAMTPAIMILILAWSIGAVCNDLHTADYLVGRLTGVIAPELLPGLVFLVAAAVSFSTGTSWGTMTILTPLTVPLVIQITQFNDMPAATEHGILLSSIAAILSGAVFGDHSSPISDTTIMSSMASTADHVDHVRTQLPYALTVAGVCVLLGYVPAALGLPVPAVLLLGAAATFSIVRFLGKPTSVAVPRSSDA
ncbi:MAG: Na+/H+ antiporter NhaC family protein [Candidatus Latescibacterota bacterium]